MGWCKHDWKDRSEVLRKTFSRDPDRPEHGFFVCDRCLRIDEVPYLGRPRLASSSAFAHVIDLLGDVLGRAGLGRL